MRAPRGRPNESGKGAAPKVGWRSNPDVTRAFPGALEKTSWVWQRRALMEVKIDPRAVGRDGAELLAETVGDCFPRAEHSLFCLRDEPTHQLPLIRTWWPRAFPVPPQWRLSDRVDSRDLLMIRPFVELARPLSADDVFSWRSDYF